MLLGLLALSVPNILLSASVPAMINHYYLSLGAGMMNQYLFFVLINLIFFLCSLIYLAGSLLAAWKEKSPEHRYHRENLFFFGQILSKLNTTSKNMSLISVTLVLAICMFIAAPILVGWASGYLDVRSVYDVQIFSRYNDVYEEENLPLDDYGIVTDFLAEHGIQTDHDCTFSLYLPGDEEQRSFLKEHPSVMTDAGELNLTEQSYYEEAIGETAYNSYTNVLYVFPDHVCEQLLPVIRNRYITTAETISYENARELERIFSEEYPETADTGVSYSIRLSTLQINSTKANNFILQTAMLYGAVVLMVICLTILSLQQLLDADQYHYRFSVLRKLGVEEPRIGKLILKQLGVWFGLPIIVAVIVSTVVIAYFVQTISAEISAYIGFGALMLQTGITVGILALLLICYFLCTWILFRRSVAP